MNLIDVCIITIGASFIMKIRQKLELYKDIADQGYKFNLDNLQKYNEEIETESDLMTNILGYISTYIPFINIYEDVLRETRYYSNKTSNIQNLLKKRLIEKMTEEESQEYSIYKTGFHAIKMEKKRYFRELKAKIVAEEGSIIKYELDKNNKEGNFKDKIIIVKVEGPAVSLTEEDIKDIIYKHTLKRAEAYIKYSKDLESEILEEEIEIILKELAVDTRKEYKQENSNITPIQKESPKTTSVQEKNKPKTKIRRP